MCRAGAELAVEARTALGTLLGDLADALATSEGLSRDDVTIGPVDFGAEIVTEG